MKILWQPAPGPQSAFLASTAREILYGGAAGGGKTDALIAKPLSRVHHNRHRSLILRRTRPQLQEVIDRTQELYPAIAPRARWIERESRWYWPSGAITQMGYAENEADIRAFKSFEYDLIAFDELTSFTKTMYLFMFSRNRTKSADLPPQMLGATNPGDIGHAWVDERFVRNRIPFQVYQEYQELSAFGRTMKIPVPRQFIPAKVWDNIYLPNREQYVGGLLAMGEEGQMFLHGIWSSLGGAMFKRPLKEVPRELKARNYFVVRTMDYGLADPTAIYWLVVYPSLNSHVTVAGELYLTDTSLDGIADAIKDMEKALKLKAPVYSVIDPKATTRESDKQSIATKLDALGIWFTPANNDRPTGWAEISRRLYAGSLDVWQDAAPNLTRTLGVLQRDSKKPSDILQRQEDHAADSLRYGLMEIWDKREETPEDTAGAVTASQRNKDDQLEKMMQATDDEYVEGLGYFHG